MGWFLVREKSSEKGKYQLPKGIYRARKQVSGDWIIEGASGKGVSEVLPAFDFDSKYEKIAEIVN